MNGLLTFSPDLAAARLPLPLDASLDGQSRVTTHSDSKHVATAQHLLDSPCEGDGIASAPKLLLLSNGKYRIDAHISAVLNCCSPLAKREKDLNNN